MLTINGEQTSAISTALYFTAICIVTTACSPIIKDEKNALALPAQDYMADEKQGAADYKTHCAACHGKGGSGTDQGPPLVHKIYRPAHHSDMAFYKAAQMGTYQHHWRFGNMPAVKNISPEQIANIIAFVRSEQRRAGIR